MQAKNWGRQQVLSSSYPFPEVAKKPLCVEHHIFLAGQLQSGIFSVPWLKLTKGSDGVFFAKPQQQQRVHRAHSYSTEKQLNIYIFQEVFMFWEERAAARHEMFQSLTYRSLNKISQVTFYSSCLCTSFYPQLEILSPT